MCWEQCVLGLSGVARPEPQGTPKYLRLAGRYGSGHAAVLMPGLGTGTDLHEVVSKCCCLGIAIVSPRPWAVLLLPIYGVAVNTPHVATQTK